MEAKGLNQHRSSDTKNRICFLFGVRPCLDLASSVVFLANVQMFPSLRQPNVSHSGMSKRVRVFLLCVSWFVRWCLLRPALPLLLSLLSLYGVCSLPPALPLSSSPPALPALPRFCFSEWVRHFVVSFCLTSSFLVPHLIFLVCQTGEPYPYMNKPNAMQLWFDQTEVRCRVPSLSFNLQLCSSSFRATFLHMCGGSVERVIFVVSSCGFYGYGHSVFRQ